MAVMVQPPVEGPNVTVTIAAVEPKLEELEDFYEETKKKRKVGELLVIFRLID